MNFGSIICLKFRALSFSGNSFEISLNFRKLLNNRGQSQSVTAYLNSFFKPKDQLCVILGEHAPNMRF